MPIYAYKCSSCGHADDVLQKISAAPLTVCPACGQSTYSKQVTAPQFQLKGSGWYVTDFRGGGNGGAKDAGKAASGDTAKSDAKPESSSDSGSKTETAACPLHSAPTTAKSTPAPAAKPAAPAAKE